MLRGDKAGGGRATDGCMTGRGRSDDQIFMSPKLLEKNVAECLHLKISILVIVVLVVLSLKHSLLLLILCNIGNGP